MALSTGTTFNDLLIQAGDDFVKCANAFLVKVRFPRSVKLPRTKGVGGKPHVGGYFLLSPLTMKIARDQHGNVLKYKQQSPTMISQEKEFNPEDVIHLAYKRDRGMAFGVPFLWPVLEDVKLLRQLEGHSAKMIWKYIFPLIHAQVGLPQPGLEATEEEIEEAIRKFQEMPEDGIWVTPERHKLSVVGIKGAALDIEKYLRYFEQRVFTGMGVSEVTMGRGSTANRGTADNLDQSLKDHVKAMQRSFAEYIDNNIILELLLEGGFDPINNPDDDIDFVFREIDLDMLAKKENSAIFKFQNNAITWDEMRLEMGMEPTADESRLYFNMITIPTAQIGRTDAGESRDASNRQQPENQYGKKPNKGKPVNQSLSLEESRKDAEEVSQYLLHLRRLYHIARDDIIEATNKFLVNKERGFDDEPLERIESTLHLTQDAMRQASREFLDLSFNSGMAAAMQDLEQVKPPSIDQVHARFQLQEKTRSDFERLSDDLYSAIKAILDGAEGPSRLIPLIHGAFGSLEYRTAFIAKTQCTRAFNYGYALTGRALGRQEVYLVKSPHEANSICLDKPSAFSLSDPHLLDHLPPFHPNCDCRLTFANEGGE